MKVGVMGLGWWGPKLLRNFVARLGAANVVACDTDATRAHAAEAQFGTQVMTDPDAMLHDPSIDGVAIATPPATHYALTRRALEIGKHVLVEKPPTMTVEELDELVHLAGVRRRTYMADSTYIYAPMVRTLRVVLQDERLGAVRAVQSLRYGDNLRQEGRGRLETAVLQHGIDVVEDLIFHDLAILAYLFNEPLDLRSINRFDGLERGIADVAYVDGSVGSVPVHIGLSWTLPERRRDIVIFTDRAVIRADDLAERDKVTIYWTGPGASRVEVPPASDHPQEPLLRLVSHFVDCAESGAEPETGPTFMRRAMLGFAACRAHRGHEPVGA